MSRLLPLLALVGIATLPAKAIDLKSSAHSEAKTATVPSLSLEAPKSGHADYTSGVGIELARPKSQSAVMQAEPLTGDAPLAEKTSPLEPSVPADR